MFFRIFHKANRSTQITLAASSVFLLIGGLINLMF